VLRTKSTKRFCNSKGAWVPMCFSLLFEFCDVH